jgi:dTDP-4-amino-4,6-dideoxygalactose transaminase
MIPVIRPLLDETEVEAIRRVVLSGWVTQGPEVEAFEEEFAAYTGAQHACAVSSCTTALHLALKAVGAGPGDEVITVSHSFIATANSIRYCSAIPVFVDVEPGTFNMNPELIEPVITRKTRAILCVHQMGMPCDLRSILAIARRRSLPLVEDAACAVGSEVRLDNEWQRIGRPHADVACFSFHPRKLLTTGDGGMLTTNNDDYDRRFRLWRQHSMSVPDTVRHAAKSVVFEEYGELGYNYRMTDIQAAMGRVQLARLPDVIARRRQLAGRYFELLSGVPGLALPVEPEWARSNWQSFCVRLPEDTDQRRVMQHMLDSGIATRRGVMCSHREPAYRTEPWSCGRKHRHAGSCTQLAESEKAQDHAVILPLYHAMTEAEQFRVAAALKEACVA